MQFSTNLDSLSVGNRTIDFEHQILGRLIIDISQLISVNHIVALSVAIRMLHDSLHNCFVVEESIAQAVGFDFTQHRLSHENLSNNFRVITEEFMSQNDKRSNLDRNYFIDSLNGLLIQHIKEDSKPFKIVLDTHLYDFRPSYGSPQLVQDQDQQDCSI